MNVEAESRCSPRFRGLVWALRRSPGCAGAPAASDASSTAAPASAAPSAIRRRGRRRTSPSPNSRIRRFPITASIPATEDGEVGAVPERRRKRPARPFVAARRRLLGGRDLQRPPRAARRLAEFRSQRAGAHRGLFPRQPRDARARRGRTGSRRRASSPQSGLNARAGRAAIGGRRARFQRRQFLARRAPSPHSSTRPRRKLADALSQRSRGDFAACRSSSSPIAAAICPPPIRSPTAAPASAIRASCCSTRSMASPTNSRDWIEQERGRAFFVSAYSDSSQDENDALRERAWSATACQPQSGCRTTLGPGVVAFIDAGDVEPRRLRQRRLDQRSAARRAVAGRAVGFAAPSPLRGGTPSGIFSRFVIFQALALGKIFLEPRWPPKRHAVGEGQPTS